MRVARRDELFEAYPVGCDVHGEDSHGRTVAERGVGGESGGVVAERGVGGESGGVVAERGVGGEAERGDCVGASDATETIRAVRIVLNEREGRSRE